jgi:hypothetical protein
VGHRDKGDRSRERRDRRPPLANWSSAAEFGDATIDQPTPLTGRRDRAAREAEHAAEQSDFPTQRVRSATESWDTTNPVDDEPADEFGAARRYPRDDRDTAAQRDGARSGRRRAADARDEPRRRRYADEEPRWTSDSGSRRIYDGEPVRSSETGSWRDAANTPQPDADDEPQRFRRGVAENPRRSRRALEEAARRAVEEPARPAADEPTRWATEEPTRRAVEEYAGRADVEEPRRGYSVNDDDDGPRGRRHAYEVDPRRLPVIPEPDASRNWSVAESSSHNYVDDSAPGSWRTRQTTEFETWQTENTSAQRWRSETVSWRTHETIEVDTHDAARFGTRAIGSAESGTGAHARHADSAELEAWRSETGTWRTRDTAATDSWRTPPAMADPSSVVGETDEWRPQDTPETGQWSRSRGQWIPRADDTGEQPSFTVRRYEDTGELPKNLLEAAAGRIFDHDALYGDRPTDESRPRVDDGPRWTNDAPRRGDGDPRWTDETPRRVDESPRWTDETPRRAGDAPWRVADSDERRTGRRHAADDDDLPGGRSDERLARRSAGRFEDLPDDDRRDDARRPEDSARRSRRASTPPSEDVDGGYRDLGAEPGWRSRTPRNDDDERYRAGRRSAEGTPSGRHASAGYDSGGYDDDERPTRAVTRRTPAYTGLRAAADNVITPRASAGRRELVPVGRRSVMADDDDVDVDDDEFDEIPFGYAGAGVASVAWFGLPLGAFLLWAMFLGGTARADCVDAAGQPCPAPRDAAFATFAAHVPQIGVAIVLSIVVAMLIRRVSPFWRPATVGFAGSVVGGGVTTVLFTVLNGA